jgi:tetratricopeptide (TPR) repeat protein
MHFMTRLTICGIMFLMTLGGVTAQDAPLASGDDALVLVYWLPVHTSPDAASPIAAEMVRGQLSHVLTVQTDSQGNSWYYLISLAHGWVPAEWDGESALAHSSDVALEQIVTQATDILNTDPQNLEAQIAQAAAYQSLKDYDSALASYDQAIELAPDDGRLYELHGDVHLNQNEGIPAQADLEQSLALKRKLASTYTRLGIAYEQQGEYGAATTQYQQAITTTREYGLAYNGLANAYIKLNDYDKAMDNYSLAISHDPYLIDAYTNRGKLYRRQENYGAALADYNQGLEFFPDDYKTLVERGYLYARFYGDPDTGMVDLNRAIELDPDNADAYMARASAYYFAGQMQNAIDDWKQGLKLDPTDDNGYFNLAAVYGHLGFYDESLDAYNRAIEVGDDYDFSALLFRAQIYVALGDDFKAEYDLSTYLTGNLHKDFAATAYLIRASLNLRSQAFDLALADYQAAYTAWPEFVHDYRTSGAGYRTASLREQLIPDLQNRISADPSNTDLMLQLGALYMEFGRWDEGFDIYHQYLEKVPNADLEHFVNGLENLVN